MKSCYVTGATGCVGRNLIDQLLAEGWRVVVLHRGSSDLGRLKGCSVSFREVDLHDRLSTDSAIQEPLDAIFHVAANVSHWSLEKAAQWKDNVLATRNLAQSALDKGVRRFIFTSTGATANYQGADEILSLKISNHYVRTKRLAELELYKAMQQGLDVVTLHPIIVIGRYDYNNYSSIFEQSKAGRATFALPGRISFCHAGDVARAHVQAYYQGRTGESYMLGGTYTSWLELYERIAKLAGSAPPRKVASPLFLEVAAHFLSAVSLLTKKRPLLTPELVNLLQDAPDISFCEKRKSKEHLDYESRDLESMLQDCYQWMAGEVWPSKEIPYAA